MPYIRRVALIVLLINLFVFTLVVLSAAHAHRQHEERAMALSQSFARVLESNLTNAIRRIDVTLLALLDIHSIHHAEHHTDPALMAEHIQTVMTRLPEVDAIRMTGRDGILRFGNDVDPAAQVSLADRPHFIRLRDDPQAGLVFSHPQVSRVNNKAVIVLARRINRPDGDFDGMIFAPVPLDTLTRQFTGPDLGPSGAVVLRDAEMALIARHPQPQAAGLAIGEKFASPEVQARLAAGDDAATVRTLAGPDNRARIVSYRKLDDFPFYIIVSIAEDDFFAAWRADTRQMALMALLFLLASLYAARIQYGAWRQQQDTHAELGRQEALYHELVEDTPAMVVRYRPDTRILFANRAYADFFGTTPEALIGRRWLERVAETDDQTTAALHIAELSPEQPVSASFQYRMRGTDGQTHWTQWTNRAFFDRAGKLSHLQSIGEDITERKRSRDVQAARLRLMEYAVDHSMHELLVATLDEAGALTESPIGFYHFLAADQKTLSLQAWSTRTLAEYCRAEGEGRHYDIDEAGVWVEAIRERRPVIHNDYAALPNKRGLPPGHAEVLREMVVPVFRKGLIVAILGVGNKPRPYTSYDLETIVLLADLAWDFAESKRLEAELVAMATTDFLTGLFNRRNFMTHIEGELARLKRFDIPSAAVLMLDLDHFKRVNDEFGHAVGDAVLKHFASLVHAELRKIDTGGRLGGEEFAILLVGADLAAAQTFAERMRSKVADTPLAIDGQRIAVTVSIGIAALEADDANADAALLRADAALYDAKRSGRNRVCVGKPVSTLERT